LKAADPEVGSEDQKEQVYQLAIDGDSPPTEETSDAKDNNTGLPDQLKSGIENLSGFSLDDVKVHYNSSKPAQLKAHAYAQGSDIHLGPGQEKHLPHEAWHVVQQKQGRVQATTQMKGIDVNDDSGLEKEADVMGARAMNHAGVNATKICRKAQNRTAQLLKQSDVEKETQNGKYKIKKDDPSVLYSTRDAALPKPNSLYTSKPEIYWQGLRSSRIWKWTPNVRLFPMKEHTDYENKETYIDKKEKEIDRGLAKGAELGMLGDNDCLLFAAALHELIAAETTEDELSDETTNPGTLLKRDYAKEFMGCSYHAVTTVANDGNSIVTLEAHAGKEIDKPEFNIYSGKEGFYKEETPEDEKEEYENWGTMMSKGPNKSLGPAITTDSKDSMLSNYEKKEAPNRMLKMGVKEKDM